MKRTNEIGFSDDDEMLQVSFSAVLMFLVAFVACYVPARRAAKVNPVIALR